MSTLRHEPGDGAPGDHHCRQGPIISAEIGGMDLSTPLATHRVDEIHRGPAENSVIFFRDQAPTQDQQLSFQCRFRWPESSVAFCDNRYVQHRAMWDDWAHTRSGSRATLAGERLV